MLLLIGARSHDAPRATGAPTTQTGVSQRTDSERAWNEQEDLKAARYVGQPGIY